MNFHQSDQFYHEMSCDQSDEFLLEGVISIQPKKCISVKVIKCHHIDFFLTK